VRRGLLPFVLLYFCVVVMESSSKVFDFVAHATVAFYFFQIILSECLTTDSKHSKFDH
jgi:hypothetical protein